MEIFQLKEFTTLVKTHSFSETSYELNISDSALSRHIQLLEKEIGAKLLDRTTRSIALTEYGKEFLPYAFKILKDYDDGMAALSHLKDNDNGSFKLGVYYSMYEYSINDYISGFLEYNSKFSPVISFGNLEDLELSYKNKVFNVYTSVNNPAVKDFNFLKVGNASVKAVVPSKSKLSKKTKLTLEDLSGIPLFLPGVKSPFTKEIMKNFSRAGIKPKIASNGRFEESISLLREGGSVGLFYFRTDIEPEIPGIKILDISPEIIFEYGISFRDNLNSGEQAFIDYMRRFEID